MGGQEEGVRGSRVVNYNGSGGPLSACAIEVWRFEWNMTAGFSLL